MVGCRLAKHVMARPTRRSLGLRLSGPPLASPKISTGSDGDPGPNSPGSRCGAPVNCQASSAGGGLTS
eukprot:6924723-Pyramimonas_sp.AAC.1